MSRNASDVGSWPDRIRQRYENYLKTSFFFKDPALRISFQEALRKEGNLLHGPFREPDRGFESGVTAQALAQECFGDQAGGLAAALMEKPLYTHQEHAVRSAYAEGTNVVVATGTASGKTESFLYPILFELYAQHLAGELDQPGVRAMILYPMNALANDQRERLGRICDGIRPHSDFAPTFGQYIGQTPEDLNDHWRNPKEKEEQRLPGELVFRSEMRKAPPHILLTNYSMLEYLLIRPDDSPLFDGGRGSRWQYIVLDEAHQYRGAKGMEMGMLIRRLKERVRIGGRTSSFRCIATSATISSGEREEDKEVVAKFAQELFGEPFSSPSVIFGDSRVENDGRPPRRYHAFLRALEGAFLVHKDGEDTVVLNRTKDRSGEATGEALEIALCRECGQHYYVGRKQGGKLSEAIRDATQSNFGADFYLPTKSGEELLCRRCGTFGQAALTCGCDAVIQVARCEPHKDRPDQLKECATCGYQRGGIGDPVQEIVHGSDGPNAVIATALHELLPSDKRKVLAFVDSRQEAAFFAWYAQDSYEKLRDRNLLLKAIQDGEIGQEGLSLGDLQNRLRKKWDGADLFRAADTNAARNRQVLVAILREALTDERRLSLSGVGLVRWSVAFPADLNLRKFIDQPPWNFTIDEARTLAMYLMDELRGRRALQMPAGADMPNWPDVSTWPQRSYCYGPPGKRKNVSEWGAPQSSVIRHFLPRLLARMDLSNDEEQKASKDLMRDLWFTFCEADSLLVPGTKDGTRILNPQWLRVARGGDLWECDACATITAYNIRGVCPRNRCPGRLYRADLEHLENNHYRILYQSEELPPLLTAKEHTAQIDSDEARKRQDEFKRGKVHLLSSSTTFEVGVDLGDLEAVFLRNVPPEPFNYAQRVGRAGRRDTPGLALTYCRRNPHDLYHYEDPLGRVIHGAVHPPRLRMTNEKIVLRHMTAAALSMFFRANTERFRTAEDFVRNWDEPSGAADLMRFCDGDEGVVASLRHIVPRSMHEPLGIEDGTWVDKIAGSASRLADVEHALCSDYREMNSLRERLFSERKDSRVARVGRRLTTIAEEPALNFLSRKAVIPKYGFPVDVVELETHSGSGHSSGVSLQRDLSQAIAEYAPGGKVVANKLEWESCGVRAVAGKAWPVRYYRYDSARDFRQWNEGDSSAGAGARKYLIPEFGFVTPVFKKPNEPRGRAQRLYTTRPFFHGFGEDAQPETKRVHGVQLTKAMPGMLVILCEGRNKQGFYICRSCGSHMTSAKKAHESPVGATCHGMLERFSLGHELVTDVVRLQFQQLRDEWRAYSAAYALLLGAAEALDVPDTDLNVTITGSSVEGEAAIVLYDDVPGGAGLVAQLEHERVFGEILRKATERVSGNCGCDSSCYGCLRSYRNQFAHPYLDRGSALEVLHVGVE